MSVIATMGLPHVCPMVTVLVPHVGGPIVDGQPDLMVNMMPAATVGSTCVCVGPPDAIVVGLPFLLVNGMPVAVLGSVTAHGGAVVMGMPDFVV